METFKHGTVGISDQLMQLIYEAIGRALATQQGQESFMPFMIVQPDQGDGQIMVLATETEDEAVVTARWLVAQGVAPSCVFARDSFITDPGAGVPRTRAVHIEAYERSSGHGVRFAQRFVPSSGQEQGQPIGNPIYAGQIPMPTEAEYKPQVDRYESERQAAKDQESR